MYENGAQPTMNGAPITPHILDTAAKKEFVLTPVERLRYRTRYFTDSGVIGSKAFVASGAQVFAQHFHNRHAKHPRPIAGLAGVYALKRLAEARL